MLFRATFPRHHGVARRFIAPQCVIFAAARLAPPILYPSKWLAIWETSECVDATSVETKRARASDYTRVIFLCDCFHHDCWCLLALVAATPTDKTYSSNQ